MKLKELEKDGKNIIDFIFIFKLLNYNTKTVWYKIKNEYGNRVLTDDVECIYTFEKDGLKIIGDIINLDTDKWESMQGIEKEIKYLLKSDIVITETNIKSIDKTKDGNITMSQIDTDFINAWDLEDETETNTSNKKDTNESKELENQNINNNKEYKKSGFNKDKIDFLVSEMKKDTHLLDKILKDIVKIICLECW